MTEDVKKFIEKNIDFIDHEMYGELYEQAYEWLSDSQTAELTSVLSEAIEINFEEIALSVAYDCFVRELDNFIASDLTFLSLPSFIRIVMIHTCGVPYATFKDYIIENPPHNPKIRIQIDKDGELYIERIN